MPDFAGATLPPTDWTAALPASAALQTLLRLSLTGVIVFRPVYAAGGGPEPAEPELIDLAYEHLNPAAQRMLRLPARPASTFLTLYPHAAETGIFAFYRDTFLSGEAGEYRVNYQHDGLDNYFHLAAQPSGPVLLVSFTDTADQPRTAVEDALRQSQAREQQARAEAELRRQELHALFMQAPACIASLSGPEHCFTLTNPPYQGLFGNRPLVGQPVRAALPELAGQPFFGLLDEVYRTGETYYGREVPAHIDRSNSGRLETVYFNFIYQATRDAAGAVTGVIIFAYDITEQVLSRRRAEGSEQELAAANEELQVINEELQSTNAELFQTEQQLRELNLDLEQHVLERTAAQQAAQHEAERQRTRLERLFMEAPAAICILGGSDLVYELVNPGYQRLFPGRALLGRPLLTALPELREESVAYTLRRVFETGETHAETGIRTPIARYEFGPLHDFYFNYVLQARYDEQGRIDGVVVFAYEVTEQVRARQLAQALNEQLQAANAELGTANQQLTRTNQDLDNFVYAASHDLKQPVNNLAGLFAELRRGSTFQDPAEEQVLAPLIQNSLRQLSTTIEDLAALGYAQQQPAPAPEAVRLDELVQEVLLTLEPQVRAARARLSTDFAVRPTLTYSRAHLRTILLNLLGNALKYADPARPARLHVSLWLDAGQPVLLVEDNGLGFDAARHGAELFQLFRRFHTHTEGTGVGLYLVNRIVQAHGGHIEVESQVGQGATFRLWLGDNG